MSRRVFADPSWLLKTVVGALLVIIPVFPLGYVYRVALQGRMGQPLELPDWDDWRGLFVDGLRFLVLVLVLAVAPLLAGWLISMPMRWFPWFLAPLAYMPMTPVLLLAVPFTAAGLYRFQRRESFGDAFQLSILLRMIVASKGRLVVPTLAYIGLLHVLLPVFPYALFTGAVVVFYHSSITFHEIEQAARARASGPIVLRR